MKNAASASAAVDCQQLRLSFGSLRALDNADLRIARGRILALVGENGAGKSTLVRVIAGELTPDEGLVAVNGTVALVRQQLSIAPDLTVLENIVFGAEHARGRNILGLKGIDWRERRRRVVELMDQTGLNVPLECPAGTLAPGLQQRAELLGALLRGADILLLDEPTTYLAPDEVDGLFAIIQGLAETGVSTVFISHKLREVAAHCDEVVVLRKGRSVAWFERKPFDLSIIGQSMTGVGLPTSEAKAVELRPPRFEGDCQTRLIAANGRLLVAAGEIVGIAGVAGNGQDELFATLAGIDSDERYQPVLFDGADMTAATNWERRRLGLRLIPSNVKAAGSATSASLVDTVLTAMVPDRFRNKWGFVRRQFAEEATQKLIEEAGVVASGPHQLAGELSGGNLQRLVVARELDGALVLVAHEPTRGVDFAASIAIRDRLKRFAAKGGAVLLLTSDLEELIELSDRAHVIYNYQLGPSWPGGELSIERLGELMGGLGTASKAGVS
ncbi:ATP-binding cassette domain-containing protein (plasmid) [Rhizobium sullae]|uniref:ATP-binding cassette domain-containing protein n=1 Tax=Rhizobium sullae TaxID=50338 RepID=A0ABY5XYA5_RHISU|nr:ATP-binding cassette domain-containing protein [Rhizobium sullae]UWU19480.1 ATP-binding cassette domain-containing protein [Rhizobium sullae]